MKTTKLKNEDLKKWARREIDIFISDDKNEQKQTGEMDKTIADHCECAYEAFCTLLDNIGDLKNPGVAKGILDCLLREEPLSPIEDNEEDWTLVQGLYYYEKGTQHQAQPFSIYQCNRRPSLFKKVLNDGHTIFTDASRSVCIDVNTGIEYTGGPGQMVLDELFPITMPYSPIGKIKIFTDSFKCYEDTKGEYDTFGVLYFKNINDRLINVNKYFKEDPNTKEMVEIDNREYFARKKKSEGLDKKKLNDIFDEERSVNDE